MKKLLLVLPVVVVLVTLVAAVTVSAGDCGCGCDCSPGYWKNHTDWMSDPQWDGGPWGDAETMLAILKAKGWDPLFADRFNVTDDLNQAYPDAPCHD